MKKNYITSLLLLLLGLVNATSFGQIIANDDNFMVNIYETNSLNKYVLSNDTLNGTAVNWNTVTVTVLSTTNSLVSISGSGYLTVNPQILSGTFTVTYQICQISNPNNCDTATVTVNMCTLEPPVLLGVTPVSCANPAIVLLSGLPATGIWTLIFKTQFSNNILYFTGTGTTANIAIENGGSYSISVRDQSGCTSLPINDVFINSYFNGYTATMGASYEDSNNDGLVNVGDVIIYQVNITNISDCAINNINVFDEGQTVNFNNHTIATIPFGVTDSSVIGTYIVTQNDINNGSITKWLGVSGVTSGGSAIYTKVFADLALNIFDGIKLNAFIDLNANGTQDNGEANFTLGNFSYQLNNETSHQIYTAPYHLYESNPQNTYNLNFTVDSNYSSQYGVPTSYTNITVPAGSGITPYNFPITIIPYTDTAVYLYSSGAVPGFTYANYITYKNLGNSTIPSGTITFAKDSGLSITSISENDATATATGFTYNFTNLQPYEARDITVYMQVPVLPNIALGDQLASSVALSIPANDLYPSNNSSTIVTTVTGSYDPNDKTESHGGKIVYSSFTANDYLTYTIRFENTGTANAINVRLHDVLDSQLDETSVRMVDASTNYILDRTGSELTWKFNGINLPPSVADTDTGKGFVVFQIKPKAGYSIGDIIPNTAEIYFDFNPAIYTNTTTTEFVSTLNISGFETSSFTVWPNPVKDVMNISLKDNSDKISLIRINDISGKTILSKTVNNTTTKLDCSALSNGLYFVTVKGSKGENTFKIIKE